jgi:hypothetical protein
MKQASASDLGHDVDVSEETVHPEALPETPVGPTIYPINRVRVKKINFKEKMIIFKCRQIL